MKLIIMFMLYLPMLNAWAGGPAARLADTTSTGGTVLNGSSTVLINGRPAARLNDTATCLVYNPFPNLQPGPIVTGSYTVLINGMPAANLGSLVNTAQPCTIATGSSTVLIE